MPRVIEVIESEISVGRGEPGDPYRPVQQYHSLEGVLLAEKDRWQEEQRRKQQACVNTPNLVHNSL